MNVHKLDDEDIREWVDNDEGLYNWFCSSRITFRKFLAENREEILVCIDRVVNVKPKRSW